VIVGVDCEPAPGRDNLSSREWDAELSQRLYVFIKRAVADGSFEPESREYPECFAMMEFEARQHWRQLVRGILGSFQRDWPLFLRR
jgi:hypothetical protein